MREGAGKVTITFLSGAGTQASPYLIASTTDWNNLVSAVNGGEAYSGTYFKMTANVGTVSTWMTGTFSGTFDGDGKTLTVGYSTSARYCAPFGTLGGTVKNLRVAGTLSTSGKNFGGIAAQVTSGKTATIQNCRVSTSFTSTLSGDNSSGSFVGVVWNGGTLNITGCAFTGSLTGSGNAFGGFLGYKENTGTCSMTDCLFAPASVTVSTDYAGTFSRPSAPTITNCYFTRTFGGAQGLQARSISAGTDVTSLAISGDATATYNVSGITVYSTGIKYNDVYYAGNGESVSLTLSHADAAAGYVFNQYAVAGGGTLTAQTETSATLSMTDANQTINAQWAPTTISSASDWDKFCEAVNGGFTYSGKTVKLTANISVSERTSTSQINPFSGTFDGDGYTLNLSINETGTDATTAAPFGYVVGGTIKNVNVTGSVQTVKTRPASLVGFAGTNCTILNCKSSAAVSSSLNNPEDGDVDGGAFVACVDGSGTLTITGCTFTGSITFSDEVGYEGGGFVGWMRSGSSATLTDCLFAPTAVSLAKASPDFKMFAYDNTNTTLTLNNCYYNGTAACNEKITKQDGTMQMHTIAKGDYVSSLSVTKGDATATYAVSGITVYSGGIDFNDGSTTTFYGGSGQTVSLALTAETRDGYHFKQYAASQGSLSGETTDAPTLTMPAANSTANDVVVISAEYEPTYNATFAQNIDDAEHWTIDPTSGTEGTSVTVSYTGENKVKSVTVKANPSTLAGLKAAINDASDLTDLNTKFLGKYVTATGNIQSTSEGAVGIIAYISKTAVDNSFADSRIFVLATENASNSAAQAPNNNAETTYNTDALNGYAVTNAWQALDGYAASKAGWNYSASRPDGASHWFVPSYGQWVLGGPANNKLSTVMRSTLVSGALYAVSTGRNTDTNDNSYCVDCGWWGMGSIQRIQAILVRAAFVY